MIDKKSLSKKAIKFFIVVFSMIAFVLSIRRPQQKTYDVMTNFEFTKYSGKWYKIARVENHMEKDCVGDIAEYSFKEDGTIFFEHSCNLGNRLVKHHGHGKFVSNSTLGSLELKKSGLFNFFSYQYNIIAVDASYSFAIVAGQYANGEEFVWLLSREDRMDYKLFLEAVDYMKKHNLDIDRLIYVKHKM